MCRSIKCLAHFEPPATDDELHEAALQFVRKLSGTRRPSRANEAVFSQAVNEVAAAASAMIRSLEVRRPARNRDDEARKAREKRLKILETDNVGNVSSLGDPAQPKRSQESRGRRPGI